MRKFLQLALLLVLTGCITTSANGLFVSQPPTLPRDYAKSDAGYLVASMGTASDTNYDSYTLNYRSKDGKVNEKVYWLRHGDYHSNPRAPDYTDNIEQTSGIIELRRLPAGEYEIYAYKIHGLQNGDEATWTNQHPFSYSFTIAPRQTTYLGSLTAHETAAPNDFGYMMMNGFYFSWEDQSTRDIAFARRHQQLSSRVTVTPPNAEALNTPYIRAALPE